jgi:hypothetical protein
MNASPADLFSAGPPSVANDPFVRAATIAGAGVSIPGAPPSAPGVRAMPVPVHATAPATMGNKAPVPVKSQVTAPPAAGMIRTPHGWAPAPAPVSAPGHNLPQQSQPPNNYQQQQGSQGFAHEAGALFGSIPSAPGSIVQPMGLNAVSSPPLTLPGPGVVTRAPLASSASGTGLHTPGIPRPGVSAVPVPVPSRNQQYQQQQQLPSSSNITGSGSSGACTKERRQGGRPACAC